MKGEAFMEHKTRKSSRLVYINIKGNNIPNRCFWLVYDANRMVGIRSVGICNDADVDHRQDETLSLSLF